MSVLLLDQSWNLVILFFGFSCSFQKEQKIHQYLKLPSKLSKLMIQTLTVFELNPSTQQLLFLLSKCMWCKSNILLDLLCELIFLLLGWMQGLEQILLRAGNKFIFLIKSCFFKRALTKTISCEEILKKISSEVASLFF